MGGKPSGPIVLILDALNQLEDRDGAPDLLWLPPVLPENMRLVVSTLSGRALEEITKRKWPVFKVEPLSVDERKELIRVFLRDYSRSLSPARVDRIAAAPPSANPLYLRVLLDELRLFGYHERLEERIGYYLPAESRQQQAHTRLADYFERQPPGPRRTDELPWQNWPRPAPGNVSTTCWPFAGSSLTHGGGTHSRSKRSGHRSRRVRPSVW